MGHVKTAPQVGMDGQPSGNTMLEITYGGLESPYGGLDTGASPAYIDPKCFASADNFLVVDNKLVVTSWAPFLIPTVWSGSGTTPTLLKVGSFFNSNLGQLNYALGYVLTNPGSNPGSLTYTFYMTPWRYNNLGNPVALATDTLSIKLYNNVMQPVKASVTLPILQGESLNFTDSGTVGLQFANNGTSTLNVTASYAPGSTVASIVNAMVTAINAGTGTALVTAVASADGYGVTITANTAGVAGNNISMADSSFSSTTGNSPAFYFPSAPYTQPNYEWQSLIGGANSVLTQPPQTFHSCSTTSVGGVLYIGGLGPMILKYSGPGTLAVSSMYAGVQTLKKFGGSLIGLGTIPALGVTLQNANMIFSWSAANNLDEWNPVTATGLVTGAGFAQLADIGDSLVGLVVTNNTAFILRAHGLSYATASGNATSPFQFAHIGLAGQGEGAQASALICEYDQTGAYVGATDIFQISGSITAIGMRIKAALFNALDINNSALGATTAPVAIGGDSFPLIVFMIGSATYLYNPDNETWMYSDFLFQGVDDLICSFLAGSQSSPTGNGEFSICIVAQATVGAQPLAYQLEEGLSNTQSISSSTQVTFPQEELLFGRDVTIDALYVSIYAQLLDNIQIQFLFNGVLFSSLVLQASNYPLFTSQPIELQVFPNAAVIGTGVFTSHSPQLQINIPEATTTNVNQIRFSKIQLYGSFDPNQRPV